MADPLLMNRREFGATLGSAALGARAGSDRPNILLILSDDHTAEFPGCYGNSTIHTANLDRFAAEGMRFTRCQARHFSRGAALHAATEVFPGRQLLRGKLARDAGRECVGQARSGVLR